ncbi:MAG: YeeE/YedE family protein [Methylotenera sp.]|nr:YeeE/YedE family protein [Methylotenera sp.]
MKNRLGNASALIFALLSGLIFGLGLILAGMANPAKVLAFLDLAGWWDPSLGLVMGGAIAVGLIAFKIAGKRSSSFLGLPMNLPTSRMIDKRLVVGGLVFGIGWGLVGICPAPAFVLLGTGSVKGIVFLIAMLIGMGLFELFEIYCKSKQASTKS